MTFVLSLASYSPKAIGNRKLLLDCLVPAKETGFGVGVNCCENVSSSALNGYGKLLILFDFGIELPFKPTRKTVM